MCSKTYMTAETVHLFLYYLVFLYIQYIYCIYDTILLLIENKNIIRIRCYAQSGKYQLVWIFIK